MCRGSGESHDGVFTKLLNRLYDFIMRSSEMQKGLKNRLLPSFAIAEAAVKKTFSSARFRMEKSENEKWS